MPSQPLNPQLSVVTTVDDVRRQVARARQAGRTIALVPTMGALHAGHMSLVQAAQVTGAYTVVSIFVNPTQFGQNEDLDAYPRTLESDCETCRAAGVELVFAPTVEVMYPPGDVTRVNPGPLAESLCGRDRPGHFEGVCTVVARLFNIVQPDAAYFGQKDAQQAVILQRMAADLHFPIDVIVCPIVRDKDGLALSSRNAYLGPAQRKRALVLNAALRLGADLARSHNRVAVDEIVQAMRDHIEASSSEVAVEIDYLALVDAATLQPAKTLIGRVLIAGAIRIGQTRLIDNVVVDLSSD